MPLSNKPTDAEKAADYAAQAEKYIGAPEMSAAHSLLAIYYQLRVLGSDQSGAMDNLAGELRRHGGFMEEFGPGGQA